MTHQRPDAERNQRRAADPKASVWVQASAGTGKTKVLTDRVLGLLLAGTPPARLLCLTFTKAAAAEMANRMASRLGKWATVADADLADDLTRLLGRPPVAEESLRARRLFARVLDVPGGMRIETVHAFCQSLLRRFPLEAGLAPHFQVMDERDAAELLAAAQEEVIASARDGAVLGLAEALAEVTGHVHESAFPEIMAEVTRERGRLRRLIDRHGGVAGTVAALHRQLGLEEGETPESVVAAACEDSAFDVAGCRAAVAALTAGRKTDGERAALMAQWLAGEPPARAAGFRRYLGAFLTNGGEVRKTLITKAARDAAPHAEAALLAEAERLVRVQDRWRAALVAAATGALLALAEAILAAYRRHKEVRALLDYDDLILAAVRLLGEPAAVSWVLYKLDGGIDHVLIDEAQDTNPDQWAVVAALSGEFFAGQGAREAARTVFAVGDVKQSIYSFQRADPREFEAMRRLVGERAQAAGARWDQVPLQVSFRSTRAVLDAVDAVFNRDPARDGVALDGAEVRHLAWREGEAGLVELWPPVEPRRQDEPEPWKPPVERQKGDSPRARLARLVARRIAAMVGGERLMSQNRPIRAGDVMVLVRRRGAFTEDLVRELKAIGVAVAGADRMVLTEQMAVMDLAALGQALLLPEDDLALATVLKGPLIGLSEEALFHLAHGRDGTLWQALRRRAGEVPYAGAHATLAELMGLADLVTPHDLYARVLGPLGGRRRLVERLGWESEDPIDEFVSLTLAYERRHPPSLQGFLHWLASGAVEIKRDLEQGGEDAVRIMTVHGAKGLQAPIVFLPDTLQVPGATPRLMWQGEGEAAMLLWPPRAEVMDAACRTAKAAAQQARDQEYRRLLYVAMTRAEDRLYVCGWHTLKAAPKDCWYHLVRDALEPLAEIAEDAFLAAQAEAADARVLRLACPQTVSAEAPPPPAAVPTEARPLPEWLAAAPEPEPMPPRPLAPSRPDGEAPPPRSPLGADGGLRFRRGRLIHRLLQTLPDIAPERRAKAAARFLGRPAWGLAVAQQAEVAAEIGRVLDDPAFGAIFGPGSRAEVPVVGMIGERIVSGQVDRLLVTADSVFIVDFKTDRPPPREPSAVPAVYLRQMAAYRAALACVYPGRQVRCALLWTDGPLLMPLESARLDDALGALGGD